MSDELEKTLLEHLQTLARRQSWRASELPTDLSVDVVRVLDGRGWIESRPWVLPGVLGKSGEEPIPDGNRWITGVTGLDIAKGWDGVFAKTRQRPDLAWETRVSEKGKAELAKRMVTGTSCSVRRIALWLVNHIVATLIAGVLLAALLAWFGLG